MTVFKCPGSENIRLPRPESVRCPSCGQKLEIWSDEEGTNCPACGKIVCRDMPHLCWEWCSCARECIGPLKYDRLQAARDKKR